MRIEGGAARRAPLRTLKGRGLRPTSGRVRQALCNMLRPRLDGAIFVDLFAGTGSVGLEALSHGAGQVWFVEHDRQALEVLRTNVDGCAAAGQTTIVAATLPQGVRQLPATLQADMLFLDPPYASDLGEQTLAAIEGTRLLGPEGVVIWQHAARHAVPSWVLGLPLWKSRCYGNTQLSLYTAGAGTP